MEKGENRFGFFGSRDIFSAAADFSFQIEGCLSELKS